VFSLVRRYQGGMQEVGDGTHDCGRLDVGYTAHPQQVGCDLPGSPRLPTTLHIDTLLPSSGLVPLGRPQPDAIFGDGADQPLKRFVRQPCGNVKTTQALVRLNFNDVLPVIPLFSRPATASPAAELSENITELHHFIAWKPARI
jgi:hypothetical protein